MMKKLSWFSSFAFLLLSLTISLPLSATDNPWQEVHESKMPKIVFIQGTVQIISPGENQKPRLVKKGGVLSRQQQLLTSARGKATLKFEDGSVLWLLPNSRLSITSRRRNGKAFYNEVALIEGEVRVKVKFKDSNLVRSGFAVRTPLAIFMARGTDFRVRYQRQSGKAVIRVKSGRVSLKPTNHNFFAQMIDKGQEFFITKDNYGFVKR